MSTDLRSRPDGAPESTRPALTLIRRRSRRLIQRGPTTRMAPLTALAAVCAAALVFGVLLEQVILAQSAFELTRVRERMETAEARNQQLLLEMTKLQTPARIERYARNELGMVAPTGVEYVVADVGRLDRGVALLRPPRALPGAAGVAAAPASEALGDGP